MRVNYRTAHQNHLEMALVSTSREHHDVVVIGGGPGGSAAATLLARRGHRVVLLERERFPRDHVGESLLPASMPVLEELGVLPQMERAGFPKKWGATMLWGRDPEPWSWYFRETNRSFPHAYQVWRPTFDKILLDNARASCVDVREGCAVTAALVESNRPYSVKFRTGDGSENIIEADWIIDASGQAAVLSRTLGLRRWDDQFRNMAIYGYFSGSKRLPAPDSTNIFIESYEHGWAWNIPLANDIASVGVVIDSDVGQHGIRQSGVREQYRRQLDSTRHTRDMLSAAEIISGPEVVKDWSYTSQRMAGDGWVLVGDAACFVDPLFSSGVHLAMMSGVMAAAYVHAAQSDSTIREPAARVYEELYRTEYNHFRELARLFYASNRTMESYFWEARRILGSKDDEESRRSFIRAVAGQPPRGYERAVLDRGDIPTGLRQSIHEVESARRTRGKGFDRASALDAVPVPAEGICLKRKPIFADGEFHWSIVLVSPQRPHGVPVSDLVAALLSRIDGSHTTRQLINRLTEGVTSADQKRSASDAILHSLRILYADGAVETQDMSNSASS